MRHPRLKHHIACADAQIPEIFRILGLPEDTPFVRDTEGWVNLCYLSEEVVIRFNARDPELPKFRREAFVYNRLEEQDLPTPTLLLYDDTDRFGPYPVIVTKRLPGKNLAVSWPDLTPDRRRSLARSAGRMLGRLHEQTFESFGEVFAPENKSWSKYVLEKTRHILSDSARHQIFDKPEISRFDEAISLGLQSFPEEPTANLVHGDYHFGNLLYSGDRITGAVDFEWSFAGDRAWDLIRATKMDHYWPGSANAFRQGYREIQPWTNELDRRSELYRIVHLLEIAVVAARFYTPEEADSYRDRVLAILDEQTSDVGANEQL